MLKLLVEVEDSGEPDDRAAREIARQLRINEGVIDASSYKQEGPSNARGLIDTIGVIAVTLVSEGAITTLLEVVKQRLLAKKGRRIKIKCGDVEFEFESDDMADASLKAAIAQFRQLLSELRPS